MLFVLRLLRIATIGLLVLSLGGCSYTATIHRYGGPSIEAEIIASDPNNLVVTDQRGEAYEVPTRTVTEVDHPGNGWIIAGAIIAAFGLIPTLSTDEDFSRALGGTYFGMGAGIALIGALPYIESTMNSSAADLRSGVKLVPATDMPVRRIKKGNLPMGPPMRR